MKKLVRLTSVFLLALIVFLVIFFLWASSPNFSEKEYNELITHEQFTGEAVDSIYSIVTYNIGYLSGMTNNKAIEKPKSLFDANLKKVKFLFDSLNTDIIALQEIDYQSARSYEVNQQNEIAAIGYPNIAKAVNWDETYVPFPYWPPTMHFGKVLSGQSILSKYPLKEHERIVLDRVQDAPFYRDALYLERLAQVVKIDLNDQDIIVINVHLEAFDKPTRKKQFEYVVSLFKKYAAVYPVILLGDFNSEARNKDAVIQQLLSTSEIGNAAFDETQIVNTYDTQNPFKRIDYIFYTKNSIEYIDGKVLEEFGKASDHLPIFMQFKLK